MHKDDKEAKTQCSLCKAQSVKRINQLESAKRVARQEDMGPLMSHFDNPAPSPKVTVSTRKKAPADDKLSYEGHNLDPIPMPDLIEISMPDLIPERPGLLTRTYRYFIGSEPDTATTMAPKEGQDHKAGRQRLMSQTCPR